MKIISRSLTVLTMAFLVACSSDESANLSQENPEEGQINEGLAQVDPEEYNILEVENDPDFVMEGPGTENKMYKFAGSEEVEISEIHTYLAKDINAEGNISFELHQVVDDTGFKVIVGRSESFDAAELATHDSENSLYTSVVWKINRRFAFSVNEFYIIKVICNDCEQSGDNINIYWWQTDSENDNMFRTVYKTENGADWVETDLNDFTFNVTVRRDDETTYNNQSNFIRKIAAPINLDFEYGPSFRTSFEFPCEPLSQLTISEIEVNDIEEDPSGNNKKLSFSLGNTTDKEALLSNIGTIYFLSNTADPSDPEYGGRNIFYARSSVAELSEDEEVKNTGVMPPNTTTQFSVLFNPEPNDTEYEYVGFDFQVVDENNEKWCEESDTYFTELENEN